MRRPLALAGVTVAATAAVAFASPVAFAQTTAPAPGTAACTAQVNNDATVQADVTAVNNARTTLLTAQSNGAAASVVATDQTNVDNAVNALAVAQRNASNALCTGTANAPVGSNTATLHYDAYGNLVNAQGVIVRRAVAAPGQFAPGTVYVPGATTTTTTPAPPATVSERAIENAIANLSCSSNNGDLQVIDRELAAREQAGLPVAQATSDLNTKIGSLNCTGTSALTPQAVAQTAKDCGCVGVVTPPVVEGSVNNGGQFTAGAQTSRVPAVVTTQAVNPLATDGSVATTSGSEIAAANVPAGSAQTGAE